MRRIRRPLPLESPRNAAVLKVERSVNVKVGAGEHAGTERTTVAAPLEPTDTFQLGTVIGSLDHVNQVNAKGENHGPEGSKEATSLTMRHLCNWKTLSVLGMVLIFLGKFLVTDQTTYMHINTLAQNTNATSGSVLQGNNKTKHMIRLGARVPRALRNLADLSVPFNPKTDVPYFWDVHFSGETVAESVFTKCHFLIQACEHGLSQPNYNDEKLEVFETPSGGLYVNVDTSTEQGIRRAKKLGLARKRMADLMISPRLHQFSESVFDSSHKGRLFAFFRHPVNRAVSMYYYLATASWDPLYNPKLKEMTLQEYSTSSSVENNWMTRFLVNKPGGKLTKHDMLVAKEILRTKCLVGLFEDMDASLARFDAFFGWSNLHANNGNVAHCRSAVVLAGDVRHEQPPVKPQSVEWDALVAVNRFDMELYEYAKVLYRVQGEQIFGVVS